MCRRQFIYATEGSSGRWDVLQCQKMINAHWIGFTRDSRIGQQRFDLRSKEKPVTANIIKEWFLANSISGKKKCTSTSIPYCEGKHATEPIKATSTVFFVGMNDHLCIAVRPKGMPSRF